MRNTIPFFSFEGQSANLRKKIDSVLLTVHKGNNFILGENLQKFEQEYAKFSQVRFCAGVGNGFDAITLSLKALGVGAGDEVIVPANTCVPTWMAVTATGARVVAVEPDLNTCNIDPSNIRHAITPKTRAIVPVHLYGQACDMTAIIKIAKEFDLPVVEDNAQAHGASHRGRSTGSFGTVNATSFYPTKNLGALGDGGAITTNNRSLFDKVIRLRNYGSGKKNENDLVGVNSRLDEIQAAVLMLKLKELERHNLQRQSIARWYLEAFKDIGDIVLPKTTKGSTHVYHLFVIRTGKRKQLIQHLKRKGIQTMIHYPVPPHLQGAYSELGYTKGSFPVTERISNTAMSLPCWPGMSLALTDRVISEIRAYFR